MIRPFTPADQEQLEHLLAAAWQGEDPSTPYFQRKGGLQLALVAEQQGQLVGFATLTDDVVHPLPCYLGLQVHPAWRRKGLGTRLHHALLQQARPASHRPIQTATYRHFSHSMAFLQHLGFQEVMGTALATLRLEQPLARFVAAGFEVRSLAELGAGWDAEVAALHVQIYQQTHPHNPMSQAHPTEVRKRFLGPDLLPELLHVLFWQGKAVGLSSLRTGEETGQLELGWSGTVGLPPDLQKAGMLGVFSSLLEQASGQGYGEVQGEFDSTDPLSRVLQEHWPWTVEREWVTFRAGPFAVP